MNKIREREHKFRLLYILSTNGDICNYFDIDTFIDSETNETLLNVKDINEEDRKELEKFIDSYKEKKEDIDNIIVKELKKWTLERLGLCEKAIMRLAVYEIKYDDTVDTPLAINEAVVLAKTYCDVKSASFINGVLADIVKQ